MARKGKKKNTRRRRKQGISLIGVAETVALSNVATQTLFNVNAYDFVMGGADFGGRGAGANQISLRELFNPSQVIGRQATYNNAGRISGSRDITNSTLAIVQTNLSENWVQGAIGMVTVPLMFRAVKTIGRPAISKVNTLLRKAGVASTVKV